MPSGDEVTGLHAFDELDPISTVSALNIMPSEPPGAQLEHEPGVSDVPPAGATYRAPMRPGRSSPPPPPPRSATRPPAALGRTIPPPFARADGGVVPPPPRGGLGGVSVPPPPARRPASSPHVYDDSAAPEDESQQLASEHEEDTKVVPNAFEHDPDYATTGNHTLPPDEAGEEGEYAAVAEGETSEADELAQLGATPAEPAGLDAEVGAALQKRHGIDDTALLELSASTHATNIDMDWDEEEVNTKLRESVGSDGRGLPTPVPGGAPAPIGAARPIVTGGNPSPFGPPRASVPPPSGFGAAARPNTVSPPRATFGGAAAGSSFPPPTDDWESDDDALTRVRPAPSSLAPVGAVPTTWSGFSPAPAPAAATEVGTRDAQGPAWLGGLRWQWLAAGAAGVLLVALAVKVMGGEARPATVTLVTSPTDVEVLVDGRPLVGQLSPFMAQDLAADVEHEVVVQKTGFESQTHRFRIGEGEIKPLPTMELKPVSAGTGFALTSSPEGVLVKVDDVALSQRTPVKLTDLAPGTHVIRLEHPGYQPWETQVQLAKGQFIDLPSARLIEGGVAARSERRASRNDDDGDDDGARSARSSRSERRSSSGAGSSRASAQQPRLAPQQPVARPVAPAPAPAAGGNMGFLRINSRPWAQVFVDGRFLGNTPLLNAPVPAGKHKIKLTNPDMRMSKSFTLQVQAGKPTTKLVELVN